MLGILLIKLLIVSWVWTVSWMFRFAHTGAPVNRKNVSITLASWILFALYFLFFWWG